MRTFFCLLVLPSAISLWALKIFAADVNPSPVPVRIKCGGSAYGDSLGQVWATDNSFLGGSAKAYPLSQSVSGTGDAKLFQSERFGRTVVYRVPLVKGTYDVTLDFAEMCYHSAGKRVFSVSLEGQDVLRDLDIWGTAGYATALQRTFTVTVVDGVLDIFGEASIDNAQFSAIEIKPSKNNPSLAVNAGVNLSDAGLSNGSVKFRIAISSDGNWHDRDDICATAMSIAELAATGNQARLVHYDYADHYWVTDKTREKLMTDSAVKTAKMWGGFNQSIFFNATQSKAQAVTHLAAEINKSTSTNPLRILGLGPMQTIGLAVAQSIPAKRQYVTLVSHSIWNDNHATDSGPKEGLAGPAYNYAKIGQMGVKLLHIVDQNAGLDKPYSQFYWLRDSKNPNWQWLWDRGQAAAKSTFDCSDAGETYYILTGDQHCTPAKLKTMLTSAP